MRQTQNTALNSCVVDTIEKLKIIPRLRARIKNKSIKNILCDVMSGKVHHIRNYLLEKIIAKAASSYLLHGGIQ